MAASESTTKLCVKCGESKPLHDFPKDKSKKDGCRSRCKPCTAAYYAKYEAENHERLREYRAKYYLANKKKIIEYQAKIYAASPDKARERASAWQKAHPEKCHNRRARERAAGGRLSTRLAERLFKLQKGKCACCGKPLGDNYHLDHIMPLALGGTNTDDNIQLLRAECNNFKRAKHPVDYMQSKGFLL